MSRLPLTIASWDYDRVRPLLDGRVKVEGCDVNYLTMPVEECFERAYFHGEFEVAEIGFSPFLIALSRGPTPYVALPIFLSRMFRHSAVYVRADRGIESPADLAGKTIGVPEYQMSAVMWFRGYLQDEFGIKAADINWVQAGLENPGRRDKFPLNLPEGFPLVARNDVTLSQLLADGAIDGVMSARAPSCLIDGHPKVRRLFPDYRAVEQAYFRKTGIFPIMHALGIRRDIHEKHPWLGASLYKAYLQAKRIADADLVEVTALKIGLPWVSAEYEATQALMGADFWSYGLNDANRRTLAAMARYSYEQGLATRLIDVDEMFANGISETRV
ncbi:ABC transporter substrate-binding protein [Pseudolabrys taiwanensis]|uniref:ABC transporter substrate-binding protein n=1 Tax=Pseudolabrys taiwanensis TaxID=331696 RepID=A0A346A120_9HYPH|nr:ABC transporter substrate-binding protein [Pseudolabrys taiwanensis]AXK82867.1 ABC transporter substrate-binding protein [Pseudolabrys taiwanensis]